MLEFFDDKHALYFYDDRIDCMRLVNGEPILLVVLSDLKPTNRILVTLRAFLKTLDDVEYKALKTIRLLEVKQKSGLSILGYIKPI